MLLNVSGSTGSAAMFDLRASVLTASPVITPQLESGCSIFICDPTALSTFVCNVDPTACCSCSSSSCAT
jgi:hypothetical protein